LKKDFGATNFYGFCRKTLAIKPTKILKALNKLLKDRFAEFYFQCTLLLFQVEVLINKKKLLGKLKDFNFPTHDKPLFFKTN
jgi:hypothetical protein